MKFDEANDWAFAKKRYDSSYIYHKLFTVSTHFRSTQICAQLATKSAVNAFNIELT